jgi:hypothetical protein
MKNYLFVILFIFIGLTTKCFAQATPKPIVYSEKDKNNRGLFGYERVTETKVQYTETDGTVVIHRRITCYDPGWTQCWFSSVLNCTETGYPFNNEFYDLRHQEINDEVDLGNLTGNVVQIYICDACDGTSTYYKCIKIWDYSEPGSGNEQVLIQELPNYIP